MQVYTTRKNATKEGKTVASRRDEPRTAPPSRDHAHDGRRIRRRAPRPRRLRRRHAVDDRKGPPVPDEVPLRPADRRQVGQIPRPALARDREDPRHVYEGAVSYTHLRAHE